jgi:hypothetical protein
MSRSPIHPQFEGMGNVFFEEAASEILERPEDFVAITPPTSPEPGLFADGEIVPVAEHELVIDEDMIILGIQAAYADPIRKGMGVNNFFYDDDTSPIGANRYTGIYRSHYGTQFPEVDVDMYETLLALNEVSIQSISGLGIHNLASFVVYETSQRDVRSALVVPGAYTRVANAWHSLLRTVLEHPALGSTVVLSARQRQEMDEFTEKLTAESIASLCSGIAGMYLMEPAVLEANLETRAPRQQGAPETPISRILGRSNTVRQARRVAPAKMPRIRP